MEILPIVSEHTGEPTGVCLPRAEAIAQGAWCQTTNIYVLNSKGEVLCHQRSFDKERLAGIWMTHLGGHVGADETYEENAHRELFEESGIAVDPSTLIHWRTTRLDHAKIWVREFVILADIPVHKLVPQKGEVEMFAWLSAADLRDREMIEPKNWCIGTHDFAIEYPCLRAVLTAAQQLGIVKPTQPIHSWIPLAVFDATTNSIKIDSKVIHSH